MSKIFVDQVDPKTATTLTLGTTGDTVDIPTGVTLSGSGTITASAANLAASGAGGVTGTLPIANGGTASTSTTYASLTANVSGTLPVANGGTAFTTVPYFHVYKSADQSISNASFTTVTFDTEQYDNGGNFASNTFTAPTAGYYYIYSQLVWNGSTNSNYSLNRLMHNGGPANWNAFFQTENSGGYGGRLISMSASDTVLVQCYQDSGGSLDLRGSGSDECQFGGFRIVS